MNTIPTVSEIWFSKTGTSINTEEYDAMIEFAKLHKQEALRTAAKTKVEGHFGSGNYSRDALDQETILNCYPDELIK